MSDQNPYEKLGVTEDASFEEIQAAKSRLIQQYRSEPKQLEAVEAAYDAIIMDRLRMRQEGKIKVPERIRFPEKLPQPPVSFPPSPANSPGGWLKGFWDNPSGGDMLVPGAVFVILSGLTVFYPEVSILPLVIALGFGASIYFINRKEQKFWRAVLLTMIGLLVGLGLGPVFGSLLDPQLNSIGLTGEQFASLLTFFIFWLISSFLR
ncbi:MAG TPA: molecular chaperone DnaJ [Cyanobacteria bacterium UBA11149]|nr:molecular chaperone DnaJ [Cyanobacteria bacterium UBA11366]HBR72519.1 molecular chaperone DnaJ [Cyanobacteria bacterium UBA11159]HBS72697.1 molecular chaperone DnaJ [Cyanobacteria bacterium UBA11153]HBW91108.1 molecular chaperone DnaJ [Cyanobacteria bacterium UBA11149]HCA96559.1 molecular chaperone DnaJ [Cyanobacteria bacterium UBA9226]